MKTHAPEAFHVISSITFGQSEIEELLRNYTRQQDDLAVGAAERTACEWVRNNEESWTHWMPEGLLSKKRIYLGGMFPITGPYWRQPAIVEGAKMAVENVNADSSILTDYELVLLVQDTQCKVDLTMKHFVQYISNKTHPIAGIVGPGCSETAEPIAGVSKHFNTIVISYSAEAVQLTNRATFPLFFRTIPHMLQNGDIYVGLFKMWNWQQVALLSEDGPNYPAFHGFLKDLFFSRAIQVAYDRKMPRQASIEDAVKYMEELKRTGVKIVIMTSFEQSARAIICEAYHKGMTAKDGYVWFLPNWFTRSWWNTDRYNRDFNERVPCSTAEMTRAMQGYFSLSTAFLGPMDSNIVGNCTVRSWFENYVHRISIQGFELSPYGSYAYDAVLVFALGLDKLLKADPSTLESLHTHRTVQTFMSFLNKTHFAGASGPVQFVGADRTGIINIEQHIGNDSHIVGEFVPDKNETERLIVRTKEVVWLTGALPLDGRPSPKTCGIEAVRRLLDVECDVAVIIVNVMGISIFVIIMLVLLVIVKRRYDAKVRATRQRMEELGLLTQEASSLFCLDEWEITRDRVVLNRKLGEGAFGTVYGGEMFLGDNWVAVAVKTLKIGSTVEDKLDFLGEVEMMKRFDHKNIVKLLGVCTRGEPAYTIMEFMLHGDLKTFLLSRRQLVNEISRESEDIGPHGLTQMAMDVARGLKYLSSLKYVHRDLASRNCLVHAEKTVKIGDFGMTRPMYDNDYYKFNKRGMFPVRWMAPESLTDGIFGTFSDIWSYGVLLYEIMTFGSFPYQGLSNRQVLNYVKAGNTITIPRGCPQKLQETLKSCWSYDSRDRPTIDDLIVTFELNPALIVACLDAPSAAVAFEGTDSPLEMNLRHIRHRNQYQKTTSTGGSDKPLPRRGLSLSSSQHDDETKVGDFSPQRRFVDNPLTALNFSRTSSGDKLNNCVLHSAQPRGNNKTSVDATSASLLCRSISADERLGVQPHSPVAEAVRRITLRYSSPHGVTASTEHDCAVVVTAGKPVTLVKASSCCESRPMLNGDVTSDTTRTSNKTCVLDSQHSTNKNDAISTNEGNARHKKLLV